MRVSSLDLDADEREALEWNLAEQQGDERRDDAVVALIFETQPLDTQQKAALRER